MLNREIALYKKLLNKGVNISFLTYGGNKDLEYSKILDGIQVVPVSNLIRTNIPRFKFFKTILLPLKLKSLFKNIDIIKTVQVEGAWVGCLSKILFKRKLIIRGGYERLRNFLALSKVKKQQNYLKYLFRYLKIYILEYISYKLADAIILTSDSDIDFIVKAFHLKRKRKKIFHVSNYVDTNLFKPLNLEKEEKHVLFIGRLHPEKNLDNLLKAFKGLDGFKLNIIGPGPYESYVEKWNKECKNNISYLGIIPNEQLPEIINQHQMFILTSYYEGNPKTLLESMSCGAACIGTNVRGINNIIKHKENGYLCKTDAQSIKKAILTVANNKELRERISKAARDYIINNCSLKSIVEKEYALYRNVLSM